MIDGPTEGQRHRRRMSLPARIAFLVTAAVAILVIVGMVLVAVI